MIERSLAAVGIALAVGTLACAGAPTPDEKGAIVQGAFEMNRQACTLLLSDATIPRDEAAERYCRAVLFTDWSSGGAECEP